MDSLWSLRGILVSLALLTPALMIAGDGDPYAKQIAPASDDGVKAIRGFQVADGLKVTLFAAEPLLANPVAFCFDEKGRCYVAETFRLHDGVDRQPRPQRTGSTTTSPAAPSPTASPCTRSTSARTSPTYGIEHDRVRLVEDTDGDGKADKATVFADGFNDPEDGIGAGVLARDGKVWFTCIPDLWLLRDTKGTGKADVKKSLHTGYGVHVAFIGHDLHGLRMGPDGKLYFSIGDRGLHVDDRGPDAVRPRHRRRAALQPRRLGAGGRRHRACATRRSWPSTSTATSSPATTTPTAATRPAGSTSSRAATAAGASATSTCPAAGRGTREKLWHPPHDTPGGVPRAAARQHRQRPVRADATTPASTLLPEKYKRPLLPVRLPRRPRRQRHPRVRAEAEGRVVRAGRSRSKFVWSVLATDCDFGPDGGFYVSDWVDGWGLTGQGPHLQALRSEQGQ